MKRVFYPLMTALVFFGSIFTISLLPVLHAAPCCSKSQSQFESCEKMYVCPQQITVNEKGIFIQFNEEWFQTGGVFSDKGGVFILDLSPSAYGCPDPYVSCRNCKRCIHEVHDVCPYCGKPA